TSTVYVSAVTFGRTYTPVSFVVTGAVFVPRASLMRTTVAPGTTPPCASFTTPVTLPVVIWAETGLAARSSPISAANIPSPRAFITLHLRQKSSQPPGKFAAADTSLIEQAGRFYHAGEGLSTKRKRGGKSMQNCRFR